MKLPNTIASFFAQKMSPQVKELYSADLILNFAISAVNIFEAVFLYLIFIDRYPLAQTLQWVLFFYLLVYIPYFFLIPLGARFAKRFGYEHSIAVSSIFTILFYLSLFGITKYFWLFWVAAAMYVLSKMFYWPAYHSDFAHFATDGNQGRQISNLVILRSLVYILGPIIGGFILEIFGFGTLFVFVSVIILLSNIPTLITKEIFTPEFFPYGPALKRVFSQANRRQFLAHLGFGEELVALTVWPIFIYVVVQDFFKLGVLVAVSVAVTTAVYLYIGKIADGRDKKAVLRYGSLLYFFGWLFRILARNVLGVFLVDSYSRITKQVVMIPFMAKTYEKAQDTSVMSSIVFFVMSLVAGKIITIFLSLLLLQIFAPGWNALFILAGLMTLFYTLF